MLSMETADDLMISIESMEELLVKVQTWKSEIEKKGLRVDLGNKEILVTGIKSGPAEEIWKRPLWCPSDRSRKQWTLLW